MGADRAVSPGAEVSGALPDDRSAGGDERDPVSGLVRLPVVARQAIARQSAKKGGAHAAVGLPSGLDGARLFLRLAERAALDHDQPRAGDGCARGCRARSEPERRRHTS